MLKTETESNLLSQGVSPELAKHIPTIIQECKSHGLDPFELVIEEFSADEIAELGAYGGFPVRYPHFSFGQQYQQLHNQYHSGMGKIYEMVVNNDPTYMYLQRNNPLVDNLTVVAHALAHSDFFKNNIYFRNTNRNMMNVMANHGQRIRQYGNIYGRKRVADFLDACLSIDDLIDPSDIWSDAPKAPPKVIFDLPVEQYTPDKIPSKHYMDDYVNTKEYLKNQRRSHFREKRRLRENYPDSPQRDVLLFILKHFRLEPWKQNILSMVREESIYYRPQMVTKVLNEGWASYWDSYIMTKCNYAEDGGIISYAKHHAGVLGGKYAMNNPYRLGNYLLRDVEDRWDKGKFGREWRNCDDEAIKEKWNTKTGLGREKIYEVRRDYNDVNFINEFFTPEFCKKHEYFEYVLNPVSNKYEISGRDFDNIKQTLLKQYTNGGRPVINVTKFHKKGIELTHTFTGDELDNNYLEGVLKMLYRIIHTDITLHTKTIESIENSPYARFMEVVSGDDAILKDKKYFYDGYKVRARVTSD